MFEGMFEGWPYTVTMLILIFVMFWITDKPKMVWGVIRVNKQTVAEISDMNVVCFYEEIFRDLKGSYHLLTALEKSRLNRNGFLYRIGNRRSNPPILTEKTKHILSALRRSEAIKKSWVHRREKYGPGGGSTGRKCKTGS